MEVITYHSVIEFLSIYQHLIESTACSNQIFIEMLHESIVQTARDSLMFGAVHADHDVLLIFYNDYPYNLYLVGFDDSTACYDCLIDYLIKHQIQMKSLNAPKQEAHLFMEAYSKQSHRELKVETVMNVMQLKEVTSSSFPTGTFVQATINHLEIVSTFYQQFVQEVLGHDADIEKVRRKMLHKIKNGHCYVFENGNKEVVSTAHFDAVIADGISISGVYTPMPYRGQGFAIALMSHLSQLALDQGYAFCTLMVDQTTPIAQHVYEKIGYQLIDENVYYRLK